MSVMERAPKPSALPIERPSGKPWEVRVLRVDGRYAVSLWLRRWARILYPNEVVEKAFGVPATTRAWSTLDAIRAALDGA